MCALVGNSAPLDMRPVYGSFHSRGRCGLGAATTVVEECVAGWLVGGVVLAPTVVGAPSVGSSPICAVLLTRQLSLLQVVAMPLLPPAFGAVSFCELVLPHPAAFSF